MEAKLRELEEIIRQKDEEIKILKSLLTAKDASISGKDFLQTSNLSQNEISRYSRQLLLPAIGISGQKALKNAKILIVGAGGLGCPAGIYLAAAGVGKIGIVDHDTVEISNLHRQISHDIASLGMKKSDSFAESLRKINPDINCVPYTLFLYSGNIEKILKSYDIIIDATDNVPTRYLLNDAAVLFKKTLISGSALRFEGQLTVYNYSDGPCYRCLFPKPPTAGTVTNCSEGGVLGVVTGVIGCLQALEAIKIAVGMQPSYHKKMLLFDGHSGDFKVINIRGKKKDCEVCGDNPSVMQLIDYELFCGCFASDKDASLSLLNINERVTATKFREISENNSNCCLIDVRSSNEVAICSLPHSLNIPIDELSSETSLEKIAESFQKTGSDCCYVICRRGNDSQKAVVKLQKHFPNFLFF